MNKKLTLTKEEKNLDQAIDAGEYESVFSPEEKEYYAQTAKRPQPGVKQAIDDLRAGKGEVFRSSTQEFFDKIDSQ